MVGQHVLERSLVGYEAQIDCKRHGCGAFRILACGDREFVGDALYECALAGAIVPEQYPQPFALAARPSPGMHEQIFDYFVVAVAAGYRALGHIGLEQRRLLEFANTTVEEKSEVQQLALDVLGREQADVMILGVLHRLRREAAARYEHGARPHFARPRLLRPSLERGYLLLANGAVQILAFDQEGELFQPHFEARDKIDLVAVDLLFALDTVAKQTQQIGHAFFETYPFFDTLARPSTGVAGH